MSETARNANGPSAEDALAHLEAALSILDQLEIPATITANVDLAICRLREQLGLSIETPPELRSA